MNISVKLAPAWLLDALQLIYSFFKLIKKRFNHFLGKLLQIF